MKTGPRPSSGVYSSIKSSLPSLNRIISFCVSPDNGSPKPGGCTAVALPVSSIASPNMIHDPHVLKLGCHRSPREVRMNLAPLRRQIGRAPQRTPPYTVGMFVIAPCRTQRSSVDLTRLRSCYLSGLRERTVRTRRGLGDETREGFKNAPSPMPSRELQQHWSCSNLSGRGIALVAAGQQSGCQASGIHLVLRYGRQT